MTMCINFVQNKCSPTRRNELHYCLHKLFSLECAAHPAPILKQVNHQQTFPSNNGTIYSVRQRSEHGLHASSFLLRIINTQAKLI